MSDDPDDTDDEALEYQWHSGYEEHFDVQSWERRTFIKQDEMDDGMEGTVPCALLFDNYEDEQWIQSTIVFSLDDTT